MADDFDLNMANDTIAALERKVEALSAENERLREALRDVLNDDDAIMDYTWREAARAALGDTK